MKINKELYRQFFEHVSEIYSQGEYPNDEFGEVNYHLKSIIKAMDQCRFILGVNLFDEDDFVEGPSPYSSNYNK